MPRGVRAGNQIEVRVARHLESEGWVVGSRRHIGGAGDLLAVKAHARPQIIEVKATQRPYERFGPTDRQAMRDAVTQIDGDPVLAWWPSRGNLVFYDASVWPVR